VLLNEHTTESVRATNHRLTNKLAITNYVVDWNNSFTTACFYKVRSAVFTDRNKCRLELATAVAGALPAMQRY